MAASLRATLVLVVVVTSMVPLGALAWYETTHVAGHARAFHEAERENAALAAATRAQAAAAAGDDPHRAAGPDALLVAVDGAWTSGTEAGRDPTLARLVGDSLSGVAEGRDPRTGEPAQLAWARAPSIDRAVVVASAPFVAEPRPFFLGVAVPLLSGVALLAVVVTYRVVRPLERLRGASAELAAGDWTRPLSEEGGAEVRALARSFNRMAEELVAQRRALERYASDARGDVEAVNFAVAHELREPLRSMRTLAAAVGEDDDPGDARRALAMLHGRLEHLERVVLDLLRFDDLARRPLAPVRVDLGAVVDDAARGLPVDVQRDDLPTARADEALVREAVGQVLRNVAEHGGGRVRVHGSVEDGKAVLAFDDEGPGVPPARRDDAFHLFQRLRSDSPGTGVGLAIVRRVASLHGGEARLGDAPQGGARLTLELALDGPPARPTVPEPPGRAF